jgi:hypothetical protein
VFGGQQNGSRNSKTNRKKRRRRKKKQYRSESITGTINIIRIIGF